MDPHSIGDSDALRLLCARPLMLPATRALHPPSAAQTSNLDGETNLKIRKALERTWEYITADAAAELRGEGAWTFPSGESPHGASGGI